MKQTPVYESHKPNKFTIITALLTLLVAAFLITFGTVTYLQNKDQKSATDKQVEQTQQLVREIKDLSEQNKKLNQTNVNYAYCNSVLLAKYTQTQKPITIEDLNKCIFTVFPDGNGAPSISGTSVTGTSTSSSSSTTTKTTSPQTGGSTQPTTPSSPNVPSTPQQQASLIQLQPSTALPLLNIFPDVVIPNIIEIR